MRRLIFPLCAMALLVVALLSVSAQERFMTSNGIEVVRLEASFCNNAPPTAGCEYGDLCIEEAPPHQQWICNSGSTGWTPVGNRQPMCVNIESLTGGDDGLRIWKFNRQVEITSISCENDGTSLPVVMFINSETEDEIGPAPTCAGDGAFSNVSGDGHRIITAGNKLVMNVTTGSEVGLWTQICFSYVERP